MRSTCAVLGFLWIAIALGADRGAAADAAAPVRVGCKDVIVAVFGRPKELGGRIVLGRVTLASTYIPPEQMADRGVKWPLQVLDGPGEVRLIVPRRFRARLAIGWGRGRPSTEVAVDRCYRPGHWLLYTGGLLLDEHACVELEVRVGAARERVRIGAGRRCGP